MATTQFHFVLRAALLTAAFALATADSTPNGWVCAGAVTAAALWSRRRVEVDGRSWSAGTVTALVVVATAAAFGEYYFLRIPLILVLGHYMCAVQAARLMERKKNRDHAQLLLLSALIIVIASAVSSSVSYAMFLLLYLYFAVHAVLLLQMKREADRRRDALLWCDLESDYVRRTDLYARPAVELPLRGFTIRLGIGLLVLGAGVSIAMPRGLGGFLGDWQARPFARTGFDETVDFTRGGRIEQDDTVVMHVRYSDPYSGEPVRIADERLLLRGATQENFNGAVWSTPRPGQSGRRIHSGTDETRRELGRLANKAGRRLVRQEITLYNADGPNLFTLYPPARLEVAPSAEVGLDRFDLTLRCKENLRGTQRYVVDSVLPEAHVSTAATIDDYVSRIRSPMGNPMQYRPGEYARRFRSNDDIIDADHVVRIQPTRIRRAERPDSWRQRNIEAEKRLTALAEEIVGGLRARLERAPTRREQAAALESWLRREFRYSLDAPEQMAVGGQPVMDFLFLYRQGNCQFFAAAMAMLCRTSAVNVPTRLVTGFRGGEFNDAGGFYIVRARDAHAWVECYFEGEGWVAFDPTPSAEGDFGDGFWLFHKARELYNFLDFHWGEMVLSFNKPQRDSAASGAAGWLSDWIGRTLPSALAGEATPWSTVLRPDHLDQIAAIAVAVVLAVMSAWWLLRKRAAAAPTRPGRPERPASPAEPIRSVPQYESLMQALSDLGIVKLPHATPMALARMLAEASPPFTGLPAVMSRLYRARFSGRPMEEIDRREIDIAEAELRRRATDLSGPGAAGN